MVSEITMCDYGCVCTCMCVRSAAKKTPELWPSKDNEENRHQSSSDCFPGDVMVELVDGSVEEMWSLEMCDVLMVTHPKTFIAVYLLSHEDIDEQMSSIWVETILRGI